MTVGGALLRSLENPSQPLTSVALAEWLSGPTSSAGVPVNEAQVLGLPAYLRGISISSGVIAGLPLKTYKRGSRERVQALGVLDDPNPRQTPFEFWQTMIANAFSWGTSYGLKRRDGASKVVQVWPIHPSRVRPYEVLPDEDLPDGLLFEVLDAKGHQQILSSHDLFRLPFLSIDGVAGLSLIKVARRSLGTAIAADEYAGRFFAQGTQLSGILKTEQTLDKEGNTAKRLKQQWRERNSGLRGAHDIAVLDSGLEFQPLSMPPEDAQLLETRRFSIGDISRLIGVPPHLLSDVTGSTSWGTGIEQQTIGWVVYTLKAWLTMIEQRTTWELLPGGKATGAWFAEFDLNGLLRGDSAQRSTMYASGIQWGWLSRNEVRALENREPAEGLDEFLIPQNLTMITVNGTPIPLNTPAPDAGGADGQAPA